MQISPLHALRIKGEFNHFRRLGEKALRWERRVPYCGLAFARVLKR